MLKSFNVKKIILGITASVMTIAAGIGVYQNVNNGKENNTTVSFEQKLVAAAKKYVENNKIAIETEIKMSATYLEKTGDFTRGETDGQCVDYSYVIVANDNGTNSFKPVSICENPKETEAMNLATGYMMDAAVQSAAPMLYLDYELTYSTKLPTNRPVVVRFETNISAEIISTTRPNELDKWSVSAGSHGENTIFEKTFTENGEETITIDDIGYGLSTDRTFTIKVNNIDIVPPVITGVKNGETYTENKVINFNEGTATLEKTDGTVVSNNFKSGTTVTEGDYKLVVKDAAGNSTTVNFTIDTTAPKIKLTSGSKSTESTGIDNTISYYNEPVKVEVTDTTNIRNLTYSFNNGEPTSFTNSTTVTEEGTYVIRATDSSSETGFTSIKTFVYNTTKPEIKNVNHNGYYHENKTVVIEDDLPITATFTRNSENAQNFTVASHYEGGKYVTSTVLSSEGKYIISATDAAGNSLVIPNTEVVIDKTAPTINGIVNGGYYGNSESVKIEFSDNLTETDDLKATLTKIDGTVVNNNFKSGTTLKSFADGTYKLTVVDKTDVNHVEYTFTVDTKNSVEVEKTIYSTVPTKDSVSVTIQFNKPVIITSANAGSFHASNPDASGYSSEYVISVENSNPILFTFKDKLGLTGNYTLTVSNIDKTAPTFVNATLNPAGLTNAQEVEVTLNFSEPVRMLGDNASDFRPVSTTIDATSGLPTSYKTTVEVNGRINFSFEDQVHNTSSSYYDVKNIDRKEPTVTISSGAKVYTITKTDDTKIYYFNNTVTVRFSDDRTDSRPTASYINELGLVTPLNYGDQIKNVGQFAIEVKDGAQNTTAVTIVIDKTKPTVTLEPAKNGTDREVDVYRGNVNIKVEDDSPVTVMKSLNGSTDEELPKRTSGNYVISKDDGDGLYLVTILDAAGNAVEKEFRIDSTKPDIQLTSSASSFEFDNVIYYSKPVSFTVIDATTTTLSATLDNEPYELKGSTLTASGVYRLTATDAAGNTDTKVFAIDSAKPVIEVTTTANHINDKGVEVYGGDVTITVTDPTLDKVTYTLKGTTSDLTPNTDGKYVITAKDNNGLYTITARDLAGNSDSKVFRIDTEAPTLLGVNNGQHYKSDSLSISISDSSSYTASYTKDDGEEIAINGTVVLREEGKYKVKATDVVGNEVSVSGVDYYEFVIDRTAPTITDKDGNEIVSGTYFGKDDTIKINVTDTYSKLPTETTITLRKPDNTTETITSGKILDQSTYTDGEYTLTVIDKAENDKTITFHINTEDPDVTLPDGVTLDSNNSFTTIKQVAKGESYSGRNITVELPETITKVITDKDGNKIDSILLNGLGTYTITYTAENIAHNKKVITENVSVVDTTKPTITVTAKDELGNTITGTTVKDKNGNDIVVYSGKVTVTATDNLSSYEYLKNHSFVDDGPSLILGTELSANRKYVVSVTDEEGNEQTETFIIDTEAPEIPELTGGEQIGGKTYYKNKLSLTFTDRLTSYLERNTAIKVSYIYNNEPEVIVSDTTQTLNLEYDGSYVFTVEDEVGNKETISFELDATTPTATIDTIILGGKPTTNDYVTLKVTFSEDVKNLTSTITIGDNDPIGIDYEPVGNSKRIYTIKVTSNGVVKLTFEDNAGHENSKEHEVLEIDNGLPTIEIKVDTTIENNGWYKTNPIISIKVTDDSGEIDTENSSYSVKIVNLNGVETPLASGSLDHGNNPITYTTTLSGNIIINASVKDKAGNSSSASKTIKKDETKPIPKVTDKDGNVVTGKDIDGIDFYSVPVKVSATDTYSGNVSALLDGVEYDLGNTLISENEKHVIVLSDDAGNITILNFAIDTEAPNINGLPTLEEGKTYYTSELNLTFTDDISDIVKRAAVLDVKIDATYKDGTTETITVVPNNEIYAVTLNKDGVYEITAIDEVGNKIEKTINMDVTKPKVDSIVTILPEGKIKTNDYVTLKVTFSEDVEILTHTIKIGENAPSPIDMNPVGNSKRIYTIVATANGLVEFTYKDVAGNQGVKGSHTVTEIDNIDPSITINVSDPDGNESTDGTYSWYITNPTISIDASDESGIDTTNSNYTVKIVTTDGETELARGSLTVGENAITYTTNPTNLSGDIVITANVTDIAGNNKTETKTVKKDAIAPAITVTAKDAEGNTITGTTVKDKNGNDIVVYSGTVTVTATDNVSSNDYLKNHSSDDSGLHYLLGEPLSTNKKYVVSVTDEAGNTATETFIIDTEAPEINVRQTKPEGETYYKETLNLTFTDELSTILGRTSLINVEIEATYKDERTETITVEQNNDEIYAITLDEDGVYVITVTDEVGNTKEETIYLDATAPTASIETNLTTEKPTTNGNVTLTVTFSEDVEILTHTIKIGNNVATDVDMVQDDDNTRVYTIVATDNGLVEFTFKDMAGHPGSKDYHVTEIDRDLPTITFNVSAPDGNESADGTYSWYKTNPTISIRTNDEQSTIDRANSTYTVKIVTTDGETELASGSLTDGNNEITYTTNPLNLSGDIVITANVKDKAGNSTSDTKTIRKDAIAPTLSITDENGNSVDEQFIKVIEDTTFYRVPVKVSATDIGSGNVKARDDEDAYIPNSLIIGNGHHNIVAFDEAGNENTLNFGVDTKAPDINGLTGGEQIGGKTYYKASLDLTFTDNSTAFLKNKAVITVTIEAIYKDGTTDEYTVNRTDAGTYATKLEKDGTYTITVKDEVGNEDSVSFELDAEAPTVLSETNFPSTFTQSNVTVTFNFSENVTIESPTITINGKTSELTMTQGSSKKVYTAVATDNGVIAFVFVDDAGHRVTNYTYTLNIIDRAKPEINVTSDASGIDVSGIKYYNKLVKVTATDNKSTNLTATDNGNTYNLGDDITENGEHVIKVYDDAENEETITFVIDMLPPSLGIGTDSFYNSAVSFTPTDSETAIATVVAKHTSVTGVEQTTTLTKDENDKYTVSEDGVYEITATDLAGNPTKRTITIDSNPPEITIENNSFHNTDVEFSVTDYTLQTVEIKKDNQDITLVPVDGAYNATSEGEYVVTAYDSAGHSTTRTFTIDKTDPKAMIGKNEIVNETIFGDTITFTIDDKTVVTVTPKDGTQNVVKNLDGSYTASASGTYELTLEDQAKNSKTVKFTVDKDIPTTTLTQGYYSRKVLFEASDSTTDVTVTAQYVAENAKKPKKLTFTPNADGFYTVENNAEDAITDDGFYEITITDKVGHEIEVGIVIDSSKPTFNITNNSYTNSKEDVELIITDYTPIEIVGVETTDINDKIAKYTVVNNNNIKFTADGIYTVKVKDAALNEAQVTFTIDTEAPTFNIENKSYHQGPVTVTASDATEIKKVTGMTENGATVSGNGKYTITAEDEAGNVGTITFTIDDVKPTITFPSPVEVTEDKFETLIEAAKEGSYTGFAENILTIKDELSEPVTFAKKITNEAGEELTSISYSSLGTYTITYTATDQAGNTREVIETVIVDDTQAPTITVPGNVSMIIVEMGKPVTYPNVTADDDFKGVITVTDDREKVDVNTPTDYTVTFTATDGRKTATKEIIVRVLDLTDLRTEEATLEDLEKEKDLTKENKNDYTTDSWNAKKGLIEALEAILNANPADPELTKHDNVAAKIAEIKAAKLTPDTIVWDAYNIQLEEVKFLKETDYESGWTELQEAKNQPTNDIKLQSQLNKITKDIENAIGNLEVVNFKAVVDSKTLELTNHLNNDYVSTDYTIDSWQAAQAAIVAPKNATIYYNNVNPTIKVQSQFETAIAAVDIDKILVAKQIEDKSALEAKKAEYASLISQNSYTTASKEAVEALIKTAEDMYPDKGLISRFNAAVEAIDFELLRLIPKVNEDTISLSILNKNSNYAKAGDKLILTFSGNETFTGATVTINDKGATVTKTDTGYEATVRVDESHKEGYVSYTITPSGDETTALTKTSNEIIVDHTLPTLNISASVLNRDNSWYNTNPTINIDQLEDKNESEDVTVSGIDYNESYYTVTVNGDVEVEKGSLLKDGTPITSIPVTTEKSGVIVVTVVVFDRAGNSVSLPITVNVDKVFPKVTIANSDGSKSYSYRRPSLEDTRVPKYYFKEAVHITAEDNITSVVGYPIITLNGHPYAEAEFTSNQETNVIEVTDVAGNVTTIHVVIDTEAPTVDFYQVDKNGSATETKASGIYYEDEATTYYKEDLALKIKDNVDKHLNPTVKFTPVDGVERDYSLPADDEDGVITTTLTDEGTYVISVTDASGWPTSKTIVIDKTTPVIEGIDNWAQYNDPITINFTERNLASATLTADSDQKPVNITSGKEVTAEDAYTVTITDKAGNTNSIRFRIDVTAPVVTLTTTTGTGDQKVDVPTKIEDSSETYYFNSDVKITFEDNGRQPITATYSFVSDVSESKNITNQPLTNSTTVTEEGTYTVTVEDKAGNTDTITFVVDKTKPRIEKPSNGGVYGTGVEIEITEGTVKIDGEDYAKGENGKFPKYGIEGKHELVVTDAAGNTETVTFTIDKTAPIISGIPANGINTSALSIKVKDATKTTVTIDDEVMINNKLLPEAGEEIPFSKGGKHTLKAVDEVGNTTKIEFVIDLDDPDILVEGEKDPYSTTSEGSIVTKYYKEPLTLIFSDDATNITVTVNEKVVTLRDMKYTLDQDGTYVVVVTDEANRAKTERIVIDTKDPIIMINGVETKDSPTEHFKVRPTITVTDDNLVSAKIDGNSLDSEFAEGEHTIVATDLLGHSKTIKFTYDATAPVLKVKEHTTNEAGEEVVVEHTEDFTIYVEVDKNGTFNPLEYIVSDTIDTTLTKAKVTSNVDLTKIGTNNTVVYTAKDKAGNETTITVTVEVRDSGKPTVGYKILNETTGWYTEEIKVQLNGTDAATSVNRYEYQILSNDEVVKDWTSLENFDKPTFTIPNNGRKISFKVKGYDEAGNESETVTSDKYYQVDTEAPTVSTSIKEQPNEKGWYNSNINLQLAGEDETSGVTHFLYEVNIAPDVKPSKWIEGRVSNTKDVETIDGIIYGKNKLTGKVLQLSKRFESSAIIYRIYAVDGAGHKSVVATNEQATPLKLDMTAPTITVENGKDKITENKTIKVEASKTGSYTIPTATANDNFDTNVTVFHSGTVDLKSLTEQEIVYTAKDEAGNTATLSLNVSVIDKTAPVITLNGDKEIAIVYGSTYQELGATAEDNLDETVTVTSSNNIDTYQTGTYTVTYTATDKSGNTATATRKVTVKNSTTAEVIKNTNNCVDGKNCYVKTVKDTNGNDQTANYVWYSGRLWRIYQVNTNNTVKLITEESMSGFSYNDGTTYKFKGSYAYDWLNGTFYKTLKDAARIVEPSTYCNARITANSNARETCAKEYQVSNTNVGLLTMDEYNLVGGARSFLNSGDVFYTLSAPSEDGLVVIMDTGMIDYYYGSEPYAMRPVITISANVNIVSGKGTMSEPYYIRNNESGVAQSKLNERSVGEYVQFGKTGQIWRIMRSDGASTRLISDTFYKEGNNYVRMEYGDPKTFSTSSGIGKYLNTTVYNNLFNDSEKQLMVLTKWYTTGYELRANPTTTNLVASSTYTTAYVGLARVGEMMTAQSITGKVPGLTAWSITPNSKYSKESWYFSSVGGADYYETVGHSRGFRPVIELNPDVKIKSGNGTAQSPYVLQY